MKDITVFIEDYDKVRSESNRSYVYDEGFEKYFYPEEDTSVYPHITTDGAEACDNLIEFILNSHLSTTGDWLDYESEELDIDEAKIAKKVKSMLMKRILESNFYDKLFETIKSGITYGRGLMSSSYSDCISFNFIPSDNIFLSVDSVMGNQRLYTEEIMTGEDLRSLFMDLPEEFNETEGQPNDPISSLLFTVVSGIVPISKKFFNSTKKLKGQNFKKIYFTTGGVGGPLLLKPKTGEDYYRSIPIVDYRGKKGSTLGSLALPTLVQLERYELQQDRYSEEVIDPAKFIDSRTFQRGSYNLHPHGLTITDTNEKDPGVIQTTQNLPYGIEEIRKKEEKIKRIFKWNIIEQAKITSFSQGEVAANKLLAFNSVSPLIKDFMNKSLNYMISRIDGLLMKNDTEYKKLRNELPGNIVVTGEDVLKKNLEKQVGLSRFAQGALPFIQMDQDSLFKINGDKALDMLGACYNVPEVVNNDEVATQGKQAMAQQQMQQQQLEQEKLSAEAEQIEQQGEE